MKNYKFYLMFLAVFLMAGFASKVESVVDAMLVPAAAKPAALCIY